MSREHSTKLCAPHRIIPHSSPLVDYRQCIRKRWSKDNVEGIQSSMGRLVQGVGKADDEGHPNVARLGEGTRSMAKPVTEQAVPPLILLTRCMGAPWG
jgi:hypothetical protein